MLVSSILRQEGTDMHGKFLTLESEVIDIAGSDTGMYRYAWRFSRNRCINTAGGFLDKSVWT